MPKCGGSSSGPLAFTRATGCWSPRRRDRAHLCRRTRQATAHRRPPTCRRERRRTHDHRSKRWGPRRARHGRTGGLHRAFRRDDHEGGRHDSPSHVQRLRQDAVVGHVPGRSVGRDGSPTAAWSRSESSVSPRRQRALPCSPYRRRQSGPVASSLSNLNTIPYSPSAMIASVSAVRASRARRRPRQRSRRPAPAPGPRASGARCCRRAA